MKKRKVRKITRKKPSRRLSKSRSRKNRTRKTKRKTKTKKPFKRRKGSIIKGGDGSEYIKDIIKKENKKIKNLLDNSISQNNNNITISNTLRQKLDSITNETNRIVIYYSLFKIKKTIGTFNTIDVDELRQVISVFFSQLIIKEYYIDKQTKLFKTLDDLYLRFSSKIKKKCSSVGIFTIIKRKKIKKIEKNKEKEEEKQRELNDEMKDHVTIVNEYAKKKQYSGLSVEQNSDFKIKQREIENLKKKIEVINKKISDINTEIADKMQKLEAPQNRCIKEQTKELTLMIDYIKNHITEYGTNIVLLADLRKTFNTHKEKLLKLINTVSLSASTSDSAPTSTSDSTSVGVEELHKEVFTYLTSANN